MSYSFNVSGATKALALTAFAAALDEVIKNQPVHEKDRAAIEANARAVVELMPEPTEGNDLVIACSGYLGWDGPLNEQNQLGDDARLTTANVSCYAYYVAMDLAIDGSGKARDTQAAA